MDAHRHGYFVLQVQTRETDGGVTVSGTLENLTTGAKWPFSAVHEISELVREWGARPAATAREVAPP